MILLFFGELMISMSEEEKKQVVLKLRFSKHEATPKRGEPPQMVTEWNYMRIALALLILFGVIALAISFFGDEGDLEPSGDNVQAKQDRNNVNHHLSDISADSTVKEKKQVVVSKFQSEKQSSIEISPQAVGRVVRAQLAKGIWENKPFGITSEIIYVDSEKATGIFYFTELEDMKDKAIFHVWKYEGDVIFKRKKVVPDHNWKTHTSKLFTRRSVGSWSVETVDSHNQQLNIIYFEVVASTD